MRLIDADELTKKVLPYTLEKGCVIGRHSGIADAILELIENAPTIDAEPVRHGTWELRHVGVGHYWECSECHTNPCIYVTNNTNFCPNCGAKMEDNQ